MRISKHTYLLTAIALLVVYAGCRKDSPYLDEYSPTPYELDIPPGFPNMVIPDDNQTTVEGVWLGRNLFWEKRLSSNGTQSCGSCHAPNASFSDTAKFSLGAEGDTGTRQSMALINLGWNNLFFWDGRAGSLEEQALKPVPNPIEMNLPWVEAVRRLQEDDEYPFLFYKAFGTYKIDSNLVAKAIAQFVRTMISGNSKFDRVAQGLESLTPQESYGLDLFMTDRNIPGGIMGADCFHCHNYPLMQTMPTEFLNNALNPEPFADLGRGMVTGQASDNGRFKVPTLRNIEVTGPYMHDGQFNTLDEVINNYSIGLEPSSTVSPLMKELANGGVNLPPAEKAALKAFLLTLTDWEFINNPAFSDPH